MNLLFEQKRRGAWGFLAAFLVAFVLVAICVASRGQSTGVRMQETVGHFGQLTVISHYGELSPTIISHYSQVCPMVIAHYGEPLIISHFSATKNQPTVISHFSQPLILNHFSATLLCSEPAVTSHYSRQM